MNPLSIPDEFLGRTLSAKCIHVCRNKDNILYLMVQPPLNDEKQGVELKFLDLALSPRIRRHE